jgi:hypothetical protein
MEVTSFHTVISRNNYSHKRSLTQTVKQKNGVCEKLILRTVEVFLTADDGDELKGVWIEESMMTNSLTVFKMVDICLTAETCRTVVARRDKDGGVWQ